LAIRFTFKDYERLKREQHIDTLFRKGKAFSIYPIKLIYLAVPRGAEVAPARVGFSVPKKKFRRSVHRHRVRRLMVEGWRKNKHALYSAIPQHIQLHIFLLYLDTSLPELLPLDATITACINKLAQAVANNE
jgi:ribonuclease P protein component